MTGNSPSDQLGEWPSRAQRAYLIGLVIGLFLGFIAGKAF